MKNLRRCKFRSRRERAQPIRIKKKGIGVTGGRDPNPFTPNKCAKRSMARQKKRRACRHVKRSPLPAWRDSDPRFSRTQLRQHALFFRSKHPFAHARVSLDSGSISCRVLDSADLCRKAQRSYLSFLKKQFDLKSNVCPDSFLR